MKIAVRFVLFVWLAFFVVHVIGGKTVHVGKAAMYISLLAYVLSVLVTRKPLMFVEALITDARKFIKMPAVWFFAVLHLLVVAAANFISFKEMGVNTWDLGHFIQSVYNNYHFGEPTTSVAGIVIWNHDLIHRCLAIQPLTWLYGLFGSADFFPIWQGVFLLLPGLVAIAWYKNVVQKNKVQVEPLGALLAFFCFAMNTTIINQTQWPYTFHIAAFTVFALSYLFYFQKKWTLWFVSLIVFTFQKEEFGFYAASFGFLLGLDVVLDKALQDRKKALIYSVLIILIGVLNYFQFTQLVAVNYAGVGQFALKFGMFGTTPKEALNTLFTDPMRYWDALTRPAALNYFYFFLVTSLIWRFPRWAVLKYMVPVLPMIFINGISNMNILREHYSLPTAVGVAATVILGVFNYGFKNGNTYRAHAALLLAFVILPWYGLESPFRALRTSIELWPERKESVEKVSVLDQQKDLILCCDYELCTRFTERALFLPTPFCQKGSPLLDEHVGKQAVYLVLTKAKKSDEQDTSGSAYLPWPEESNQWEYESAFLKLSKPMLITKSKNNVVQ